MAIPRELIITRTLECPRPSGEARGVAVTRVEARLTRVDRKTRGVSRVHSEATLTATRVSAREVETRPVLQCAVMTTGAPTCQALVHILTVSSISLKQISYFNLKRCEHCQLERKDEQ